MTYIYRNDRVSALDRAVAAVTSLQPVGQATDAEIDARLNALYRDTVDSGQHNGGMLGVAWDRAVYRMVASQPAQTVDLDELRRAVCVVGVVGHIDGHDVVRRSSVPDVLDVRRRRKVVSQAVGK